MGDDIIMRASSSSSTGPKIEEVRVATWNIASVNNNPFEYWVSHPDPAYNELMEGVQDFIDNPGQRDVSIEDVLDVSMVGQLFADLRHHDVQHVDEVESMWKTDYSQRTIIAGFLKDASLGKKRLASMPDRITNTIHTMAGNVALRPTVINYFQGDMATPLKWWEAWRKFMFRTHVELCDNRKSGPILVIDLLESINAVKYPALTAEEERVSIPLQVLCLAIFDSILVHMLNSIGKDVWQPIRNSLAQAFRVKKTNSRKPMAFVMSSSSRKQQGRSSTARQEEDITVVRDITTTGGGCEKRSELSRSSAQTFLQISVEITDEVLKVAHENEPSKRKVYVPGDLAAFTCVGNSGHKYVVASFHGDTNGLASIPIVKALSEVAARGYGQHTLLLGLDANTYKVHSQHYQGVAKFQEFLVSQHLSSCWGANPDPLRPTTCNARTYLQPQLNKAIRRDERLIKADKNLKDW
eukprot:CAMPEP_0179467202 /NCGR_PEP_ID=MMETSP0799-20121207/48387_1 /TAXON_ID=46947 /ORGANISM="Geminigera cryophila, Strain CCMP2564" /LENGTH=466 /DNA_ID=CAMNT_0021272487 /DNA_START=73 /DNA_END=1472 /DNA_ORIENTATION=-